MKLYRLLFILLIFVSITSFRNDSFADKFSSDSALGVLDIGANISSGNVIDENAWNRLFDTQGYQKYLATSRGNVIRVMIKEAAELAFSPDRSAEIDSILLLTPDANDYATLMSQNMCKLAKRQDEARRFMEDTDFPALLSKADRYVKKYLPKHAVSRDVSLNDLFIICTIPDASVRAHSVLMDLNLAIDMSEEEIVHLLAHEFFHNYRDATLKNEPRDSFWKIFNSFENEGIADLIDKGEHPETFYAKYGASFKKLYLDEYRNSSTTLQKLDSLLAEFRANPKEGKYGPVADLLVFNGHPTGYYMTRLIREERLESELINCFDSPAAFAELYNKAALKKNNRGGDEYILSKDLLAYLKTVEKYITQ